MNKKTILVLFNSPYLGGAERSMVSQIKLLKNKNVDALVPILNHNKRDAQLLIELIQKECPEVNLKFLNYPQSLFSASRSGKIRSFFKAFFGFFVLMNELKRVQMESYDILWANGNKIAFVSYLYSLFKFFGGTFIWHFRDYPANKGIFSYVFKVLKLPKTFKTILIGNSFSVEKALKKIAGPLDSVVALYNPVGDSHIIEKPNLPTTIGIVSMFAPWKGLSQIIEFAHHHDSWLDENNFKIKIYGGEIYQTSGGHKNYSQVLKELATKYPSENLSFEGLKNPDEIYREIDLLIHTSIKPEPFGRVLLEAYAHGVPVLTTGLGGAREIVDNDLNYIFNVGDYEMLKNKIQNLMLDRDRYLSAVKFGKKRFDDINQKISFQLAEISKLAF